MKFAVGYISFFENDLVVDIVEADDQFSAVLEHKSIKKQSNDVEFINWIKGFTDLEAMKQDFFNGDMAIDVVEIK